MMRQFHLQTTFDTWLLHQSEDGKIIPSHLIGYKPVSGIEQALDSAQSHLGISLNASTKKKHEIIHPTDEQFRNASIQEKEQWTRHFVSGGKVPAPCASNYIGNINIKKEDEKHFTQAWKALHQYQMLERIVHVLVDEQQVFLQSFEWIDQKKLNISYLASKVEGVSDSTVRRALNSLNLEFHGMTFSAKHLLCSSITPFICKSILNLNISAHSEIGAPILTRLLFEKSGIHVSRRSVGMALDMLRKHSMY